jgi:hypothetical protein
MGAMTEPFSAWDAVFIGAIYVFSVWRAYRIGYRRGVRGTLARIVSIEIIPLTSAGRADLAPAKTGRPK